jgi:predicted dehydrogenase
VHFTAGTRLLLGANNRPSSLAAYTALLQPHLPPIDTVNSIWQTTKGISGTVQISFGTSLSGDEYTIACSDGSVTVSRDTVTVRTGEEKDGNQTSTVFTGGGSGVKAEVKAWAEGLEAGKENSLQSPAAALADLELLEAMLKSGEGEGVKVVLTRQEA